MPKYNVKAGSLKVLGENKVSMRVTFTNDKGVKSVEQPFEVDSIHEEEINAALAAAAQSLDNQPEALPLAADIEVETGKDIAVASNKPVVSDEI